MKSTIFIVLIFVGFFYMICKGVEISSNQAEACRSKGGYALLERGVFQECLKGVEIIK